jgi:hypothetical protein
MYDDCMVHPDSLQGLIDAHRQLGGEYGYLSSVVRWKDGSICKMNVQRHPLTRSLLCTFKGIRHVEPPAKVLGRQTFPKVYHIECRIRAMIENHAATPPFLAKT